jgi:hypothetical protein
MFSARQEGGTFRPSENRNGHSTNDAVLLAGAYTIFAGQSFPAWPGWVCHRMLRTRSSTIKQERFLEWQPSINDMIFCSNARKRSIAGIPTSARSSRPLRPKSETLAGFTIHLFVGDAEVLTLQGFLGGACVVRFWARFNSLTAKTGVRVP